MSSIGSFDLCEVGYFKYWLCVVQVVHEIEKKAGKREEERKGKTGKQLLRQVTMTLPNQENTSQGIRLIENHCRANVIMSIIMIVRFLNRQLRT